MHQGSALYSRENQRVNFLRIFFLAQNHAAARAAQRFVRRRRHKIGVLDRARMQPRRHQSGDMRDVRQQQRAGCARDFAHPFEVNDARIGAGAHRDHAGPVFLRHPGQLIVINLLVLFADAVVDDLEKFARKIRFVAVREVAAVTQVHR